MNSHIKSIALKLLLLAGKDKGGKILFYHDIHKLRGYAPTSTKLDLFKRQMETAIAMGYRPVSDLPYDDMTFSISFDDGYRGVLECRDVLDCYGIKPTIYLPVSHIGKQGYLTMTEIRELAAGGWRFESHTWNHAWLSECTEDQLIHELLDSKSWLEDRLQKEISQICFPRGLFSSRSVTVSRDAGYKYLISSIPGSIRDKLNFSLTPRNLVQSAKPADFSKILAGALRPTKAYYYKKHFVG